MSVFRDRWGIPHVRAGSVTELAREQGRVTARDRAWQLEIERLRGEGRVAELVGEAGLTWDVFARRARLAAIAQCAYAGLDADHRAFLSAYVDGVRQGLDEARCPELTELGPAPGRWEPWTPLVIWQVQHVLFGSFPGKLWRARVREVLGDDALFRAEGQAGGSNALAVGPGRTASGLPLVAGDPHRVFEAPNVYAQVRLACTDPDDSFDVVGYTFPGVPGVQHFAHAGDVAWAITNAVADYQDLVAVPPEDCARHVETVQVRDAEPVEVEVLVAPAGPVVLDGLALRSPSHELGDLGFSALLPLLRARSVADVDAAFDRWVEPVNNLLVADRAGALLHRVAGRVPERDGTGQWSGWVTDLPRTVPAGDGHLVTANERRSSAYDRIGSTFAPPFRHDRLDGLLGDRTALTAGDLVAMLGDVRQNSGRALLDLLADPPPALRDWDRAMSATGEGAARFAALRERVVARICAAEVLAPLREPCPYGDLVAPWFHLPTAVAHCLHVILAADRPFGLDVPALVAEAWAEVVADEAAAGELPSWGERHRFHPLHAREQLGLPHERTTPATALPGDTDAVFAAGWVPGTEICVRGPVARYAWDLDDRRRGGWAVPLGASGDPASPHHADQHPAWAAGGVVPIETDWDRLTEETP